MDRLAKKIARSAQRQELGTWDPPGADEERTYTVTLDNGFSIATRSEYFNEQIIAYAIVLYQKGRDGDTYEHVCIDSRHGTIHRHNGPDHTKSKIDRLIITSQRVIQDSLDDSYDEVYARYLELEGEQA